MTDTAYAPTDRQVAFLRKLIMERVVPSFGNSREARLTAVNEWLTDTQPSRAEVSYRIDWLTQQPKDETVRAVERDLTPGVYETEDGVFVVKPNQEKTRLYAKRLVEIGGERLTEAGSVVQVEFEYAPGAIFKIKPEHRMAFDKAKELTIRYARCIVCGRHLKNAQSVERGIGPVCRKYFG